jgi:histidinol-phosphate aminotransferase
MGGTTVAVPLGPGYQLDLEALDQSGAVSDRTKLIFVVNPNNPTSNVVFTERDLERLLSSGKLVVVDEAYLEFGGWSSARYLDQFPNLIILRSLSKSMSLPGLRVAFVLANAALTRYFRRIEDNLELFNIPTSSLKAAAVALKDIAFYQESWRQLSAYRQKLIDQLRKWGTSTLESRTTFLFAKTPGLSAQTIRAALAREGIMIKNMGLYQNVDEYHWHIGLPQPSDYDRVLEVLERVIGPNRLPAEGSPS